MAKHIVVQAARPRVNDIHHALWDLKSSVEIQTWLEKEVTSLEDAKRVLAILVATVGYLVKKMEAS